MRHGVERGRRLLDALGKRDRSYIELISRWVRILTFEQLVKAIYDKYPEMRVNSIFKG